LFRLDFDGIVGDDELLFIILFSDSENTVVSAVDFSLISGCP
jgi:hypothetical protein